MAVTTEDGKLRGWATAKTLTTGAPLNFSASHLVKY